MDVYALRTYARQYCTFCLPVCFTNQLRRYPQSDPHCVLGSFSELMPVVLNVLTGVPQALSSFQMIIICVFTDVFPALSMVNEKPEADLLLRRPRDRKKDRLINWRLLLHAYFFLGMIESVTSMVG